jgi:hypothetical protein
MFFVMIKLNTNKINIKNLGKYLIKYTKRGMIHTITIIMNYYFRGIVSYFHIQVDKKMLWIGFQEGVERRALPINDLYSISALIFYSAVICLEETK